MNELAARLSPRALVALAITVLAPLLELTGLHPPGRLLLAVAFTLLVPGVAVVEVLRLPSVLVSWCLAVALSIAANILVAQAQLTLHSWHPLVGQLVVALASLALLAAAARPGRPPRRPFVPAESPTPEPPTVAKAVSGTKTAAKQPTPKKPAAKTAAAKKPPTKKTKTAAPTKRAARPGPAS